MTDELIGTVEVKVKYCGEWLAAASKENVHYEHINHVIDLLATEIVRTQEEIIKKLTNGELNMEDLKGEDID